MTKIGCCRGHHRAPQSGERGGVGGMGERVQVLAPSWQFLRFKKELKLISGGGDL